MSVITKERSLPGKISCLDILLARLSREEKCLQVAGTAFLYRLQNLSIGLGAIQESPLPNIREVNEELCG
jgi:hypothetical protein